MILGAGAQFIAATHQHEAQQTPGTPTPLASFSVTQLGAKADKVGKDDNFRGLTVFNNVVYFTKGSGSNGVNTVYFVDTTGKACPSGGVGVPVAGAKLPSSPLAYDAATLTTSGLPNNVCVLAGFPATPNKTATTLSYPFGLWFADANTLYVADEGDGYSGGTDLYTHRRAADQCGPAEVGVQRRNEVMEARVHAPERPESGDFVHRCRLSDGYEQRDQPAVVARHGRPA